MYGLLSISWFLHAYIWRKLKILLLQKKDLKVSIQCHCKLHKRLVGNERHSIIGNVRLNEVPVELLALRQFPHVTDYMIIKLGWNFKCASEWIRMSDYIDCISKAYVFILYLKIDIPMAYFLSFLKNQQCMEVLKNYVVLQRYYETRGLIISVCNFLLAWVQLRKQVID